MKVYLDERSGDDYSEPAGCAACGQQVVVIGTLGNRQHFRCRNCGLDQSKEVRS